MLHKAQSLTGYKLEGINGEIGKVKDFYFDDQHWAIRYLVTDTGNWLTGRQVLISPHALVTVNEAKNHITINLTTKQIEDSPSLESDKPVSRQFEESYYGYYAWPAYWGGSNIWESYPYTTNPFMGSDNKHSTDACTSDKTWKPNLRSIRDVCGYHVQATDGKIGHVEDLVIDDTTWAIRYVLINTQNWLPGKKVLVSPRWIDRVNWSHSKVFVDLPRQSIKQSPEYTGGSLPSRNYEMQLHQHYNRQGYWVNERAARQGTFNLSEHRLHL